MMLFLYRTLIIALSFTFFSAQVTAAPVNNTSRSVSSLTPTTAAATGTTPTPVVHKLTGEIDGNEASGNSTQVNSATFVTYDGSNQTIVGEQSFTTMRNNISNTYNTSSSFENNTDARNYASTVVINNNKFVEEVQIQQAAAAVPATHPSYSSTAAISSPNTNNPSYVQTAPAATVISLLDKQKLISMIINAQSVSQQLTSLTLQLLSMQ